jgi:hypothetical protein
VAPLTAIERNFNPDCDVILARNYPSRDPMQSQADIQMTRAIIDIAAPLSIAVDDHIIVGKNGRASMKGVEVQGIFRNRVAEELTDFYEFGRGCNSGGGMRRREFTVGALSMISIPPLAAQVVANRLTDNVR